MKALTTQERARVSWICRQPRKRCVLHVGHIGPHLWIDAGDRPLLGECLALPPPITRPEAAEAGTKNLNRALSPVEGGPNL
jgi:hypothetical protein